MECYLTGIFAGYIALDENFNVLDYELFPKDKLLEKYLMHQKRDVSPEEYLLLKRLSDKGYRIIIETNNLLSTYNQLDNDLNIDTRFKTGAGQFVRANLVEVLEKVGFIDFSENLRIIIHNLAVTITEDQIRKASRADDLILIQAINAIEEVEESVVKLVERLREWFPLHFPELDRVKDHASYVELVAQYGDRQSIIDSGRLDGHEIKNSLGADISPEDRVMLQDFASSLHSLQKTKISLGIYVEKKMEELAPNLMELTSASLGAKLIAHSGSIKRLAMLPSSTIQIMGAEKALFRHLKTGERPPKHGLIYQHPVVRGSKWWIRGKIARLLAAKISLAVRIDFFRGEKDPSILKEFNRRVEDIEKSHPFPKRVKKKESLVKKKKKKKKRFSKKELKDYKFSQ